MGRGKAVPLSVSHPHFKSPSLPTWEDGRTLPRSVHCSDLVQMELNTTMYPCALQRLHFEAGGGGVGSVAHCRSTRSENAQGE